MKTQTIPPRLLNMKEAAKYLCVGDKVIRALIHSGRIQRVNLLKGKHLVDREDLDRLIEAQKAEKVAPIIPPADMNESVKIGRGKREKPFEWVKKHGIQV